MAFTQTIALRAKSADEIISLLDEWQREEADVAPGYQAGRLMADLDHPDRFIIEVDFSSKEEADRNNDRPETQRWAERMRSIAQGEPEYYNYEVVHTAESAHASH